MENTYFNYFCELLDNNTPLSEYTANSLYYKLRFEISQPLKSEINKNLMLSVDDGKRKYYLLFLLSEIERQHYIKDAGIHYIEKHLKTYNVKLQDILDFKLFTTNPDFCYRIIDVHYKSLRKFSPEKDEAFLVQSDFVNYFCKIMADEIIDFINEKLKEIKPIEEVQETKEVKNFVKNYGYELSKYETLATEYSFYYYHEAILLNYILNVKQEIEDNLMKIDSAKVHFYLDNAIEYIESSEFQNISSKRINKYVEQYNLNLDKFPEVDNEDLLKILKTNDYYATMPYAEISKIEFIQEQFYLYSLKLETIKLLEYLNTIKAKFGIPISRISKIESPVIVNKEKKPDERPLNPIFKDENGKKLYDRIVIALQVKNNEDRRQAKLMTMWDLEDVRELIFKGFLRKKEFIAFINKEFDESFNNRSNSDSKNFQKTVEDSLKLHLKDQK